MKFKGNGFYLAAYFLFAVAAAVLYGVFQMQMLAALIALLAGVLLVKFLSADFKTSLELAEEARQKEQTGGPIEGHSPSD